MCLKKIDVRLKYINMNMEKWRRYTRKSILGNILNANLINITKILKDLKMAYILQQMKANVPLPILHHCQSHNPSMDPLKKDDEGQ